MKATLAILSSMALAMSVSFAEEGQPQGPPKGGKRPGGPPPPEAVFKKLDTNSDGSLSLDEFKAGPRGKKNPEKAEEIFKKLDADSDGSVSLEEFKKGRPPHKEGEGKGGRPPKKDGGEGGETAPGA